MAHRRSWRTPLVLLALAAMAGHIYYWYWPRERPADPGKAGPAAKIVLSEAGLPFCAWVPYPHQNLAGLARDDSPLSALAVALQALRGDHRQALPGFGPFPLPPGHGLGLCSDRDGGRLKLVAEVYPVLATLARWSGRLAANPWLAGGPVESGGRHLEVHWEGNVWIVDGAGGAGPMPMAGRVATRDEGAGEGPVLGLARMREPWGAIPAGLYRIERSGVDLSLRSAHLPPGSVSGTLAEMTPLDEGIPLVTVVSGDDGTSGIRVLAMVDAARRASETSRLPEFVVLHHGAGERWDLPREALGPLLDVAVVESSTAGWTAAALDAVDLATAEDLAVELRPLEGLARAGLEAAVWVDPRRVGPTMHRLADELERLPIVKRRYVRAWRAAALAAGGLDGSHELTVAVVGGPGTRGLEVRLEGRAGAAPVPD